MPDPRLFLAKNGDGDDALWWGTGPDDRACVELDLSGLRRAGIAPAKAVWEAIMGSHMVEDCTGKRQAVVCGDTCSVCGECAACLDHYWCRAEETDRG